MAVLIFLAELVGCGGSSPRERGVQTPVAGAEVDGPLADEPLPTSAPVPELVELGAGDRRRGLFTIRVDRNGLALVVRPSIEPPGTFERGTLRLTVEQRVAIADQIDRDQIYVMDGAYAPSVTDGEDGFDDLEIVLRIVQDGEESVIYCNGRCPDEVRALWEAVSDMVYAAPEGTIEWVRLADGNHDDELWLAAEGAPRRASRVPVTLSGGPAR